MNIGFIVDKEEENLKKKAAIIDYSNKDKFITYDEFNKLTDNMSQHLLSLGVKHGDIVMVMMSNCIELQICYFACFKIGVIMQPLNYHIDVDKIYYASSQCKPKVFITTSGLWNERVKSIKSQMPWILKYYLVGDFASEEVTPFEELIKSAAKNLDIPVVKDNDFAQLFFVFTNNQTKFNYRGVFLTHHVMEWHSHPYELLNLNKDDVVAGILHPYNALTRAVFKAGASYILITDFSGEKFIEACFEYGITFVGGTPNQFKEILDAAKKLGKFPKTLRACFVVGQLLEKDIWMEFEKCFETRVYGGIGCKELGIFSLEPYNSETRYGSIGKIVPNMEYKLEKTRQDENVGYLKIKSNSLITHYWIDGSPSQVTTEDGWFDTGFEVSVDKDGYLYLTGNMKDTSISGMKRYYNAK